MFWEIVCGSIAYLITGVMMWFPHLRTDPGFDSRMSYMTSRP